MGQRSAAERRPNPVHGTYLERTGHQRKQEALIELFGMQHPFKENQWISERRQSARVFVHATAEVSEERSERTDCDRVDGELSFQGCYPGLMNPFPSSLWVLVKINWKAKTISSAERKLRTPRSPGRWLNYFLSRKSTKVLCVCPAWLADEAASEKELSESEN